MRKPSTAAVVARWLGGLALLGGTAVIAAASLVYFDGEELPPFLLEKLPLPLEAVYSAALTTHVASALFALPACVLLSWRGLLARAPRLHRWLGRMNGLVVLAALAPSGLYLSVFAKGGWWGTAGFALSGVIVIVAMVKAIATARARDVAGHRRFALHVLAQLSVAVSSRVMLVALDAANVDADAAYLASLWLPVVLSALVVEVVAAPQSPLTTARRLYALVHRPRPVQLVAGPRGHA